jgi:hypothetical protein
VAHLIAFYVLSREIPWWPVDPPRW